MDTLFGIHAVTELLQNSPAEVKRLWLIENRSDQRFSILAELAERYQVPVDWVTKKWLDENLPGARHQGVMARCTPLRTGDEGDFKSWLACNTDGQRLILVLDGVQDPHNLGACIRTAAASGVEALVVPNDRCVGFTPTVRKVAVGTIDRIRLFQVANLARVLKMMQQAGVWLVGAAGEATQSLYDIDLTGSIAMVMGGEGGGLRRLTRENCDYLVSIPMLGGVESLNVSVATGVCLFEVHRQRLQR